MVTTTKKRSLDKQIQRMIKINPKSKGYKKLSKVCRKLKEDLPDTPVSKCRNLIQKLESVVLHITEETGKKKYYLDSSYQDTPISKGFVSCPYINISATQWKSLLGGAYYHPIKKFLEQEGVLIVNHSYSNNPKKNKFKKAFSKSYRLSSDFFDPDDPDDDEYETFEIDIYPGEEFPEELIPTENPCWLNFNTYEKHKWEKISLDLVKFPSLMKKAKKRKNWSNDQYLYQIKRSLRAILNPKPPTIGSTGREYNSLNNLPREVREAITIEGESTTELDIKSCHPFIIFSLIEDPKEKKEYKRLLTTGTFYEALIPFVKDFKHPLYEAENERDLAKLCFSKFVSGAKLGFRKKKKLTGAGLVAKFFFTNFPKLTKKLSKIMNKEKGELARHLQRIESNIVVKGLFEAGVFSISIHDGVLVKTSQTKTVMDTLVKLCKTKIGIAPIITAKGIKLKKAPVMRSKGLTSISVSPYQKYPKTSQILTGEKRRGVFIKAQYRAKEKITDNLFPIYLTQQRK